MNGPRRPAPRPVRSGSHPIATSSALHSSHDAATHRRLMHASVCLALMTIIVQSCCTFGAASAECIDYGNFLRWVGGVATPGSAHDVAVSGSYAYVASHFSILQVVDISDPRDLRIVGRIDTPPGETMPWIDVAGYAVAISGSYACVASSYGLFVVDIGDPQDPRIVGRMGESSLVRDMTVAGGLFYVVDGAAVYVIDITDPRSPKIVDAARTPGQATGVAASGDHLYVADGQFGLRVYDLSNQSLRFLGSVDTPGLAYDVAVSGDLAYLAEDEALRVIDVSNPTRPWIMGSVGIGGRGGVVVSGSIAYVAGWGLQVVDVTNPNAPRVMSRMTWSGEHGIAVSGDQAYLSGRWGLHVVDLTRLQPPPPPLGSVEARRFGEFGAVAVSGTYAYAVEYDEDHDMYFSVIDIEDALRPRILGSWRLGSVEGWKIAVSGTYSFVSGLTVDEDDRHFDHFWVIDTSDAAHPKILAHTDMIARDIAVSGDLLYLAAGDRGLEVIDVSDPARPLRVCSVDTPGQASGVAMAGNHTICVADGSAGLQVFDITDPRSPRFLGSVDTQGEANDVAVSGRFAYLADGDSGLQAIDITDPANPEIVGSVMTPDSRTVAVTGTTAYVRGLGLHVIDISNPRVPRLVGQAGGEWVGGFALSGDFATIAAGDDGLLIRPLQCDAAPQPPIAAAGGPYTGECHIPLTFDAAGSVARVGSIASYEWDWDGDGVFDTMTPSPTIAHTYAAPFTGSVRLRVTDDRVPPMSSECEAQVSVVDTQAPRIVNVALLRDFEWLKNQQSVVFQLRVEAQDRCDTNPTCRIARVTADAARQPHGNHATRWDGEITDALALKLPLDFSQGRMGRLYRVTVVSSDETGNASAAVAAIRVAFDRGRPLLVLESLEMDHGLPPDLEARNGDSARPGTGETEEIAKSSSSTEGQKGIDALGIVGAFPNPMRHQGQVQFFLPAAAQVRLAIYDVRGRLVRTLAQGDHSPGLHTTSWESRADDGSVLGQGIYFARLDVDGQRFTRRFVVVR